MKIFLDFLPIAVFFTVFKIKGIYYATAAAMLTGFIQMAVAYAQKKKIEPMLGISMFLLLVFGSLTIFLHNETFIKWKPTILYWMFGIILFSSRYFFGRNILKIMLKTQLKLPDNVWEKLNIAWGGFFIFTGALNLFVFLSFPTDIWVNFKMFGLLGCMLIFAVVQGLLLLPYMEKNQAETMPEKSDI